MFTFGTSITHTNLSLSSYYPLYPLSPTSYWTLRKCVKPTLIHIASCSVLRLSTGSTVCGCGNVVSMSERRGGFDERKEGQSLQCFWCRPAENHKDDGAREHTRGCRKTPPSNQTQHEKDRTSFKEAGKADDILCIILMWNLSSGIFSYSSTDPAIKHKSSVWCNVWYLYCKSINFFCLFVWLFFCPNWLHFSSFHSHVPHFWEHLF